LFFQWTDVFCFLLRNVCFSNARNALCEFLAMMPKRKTIRFILKHVVFLLCCAWLIFFIFVASSHQYFWTMLKGDVYNYTYAGKQWLWLASPVRSEHYVIFLFHFAFSCFIFLRKWNPIFIISLGLIFCYATYAFIFRDMILMSVLR